MITLNINGQWALGGAVYAGMTFNNGTLQYAATIPGTNGTTDITQDSLGNAKPVTLNSGGGTVDTNGNNVTYAYPLGNAGTGALTKKGAGDLALNAAATYTGNTTVSAGSLTIASTGSIQSTNVTTAAGATLNAGGGTNAGRQ